MHSIHTVTVHRNLVSFLSHREAFLMSSHYDVLLQTLIILNVKEPDENIAFNIIANTATLIESSIAAAATTNVGIPFETPYPTSRSLKRQGTTTAGDTDAIIEPNRKPERCFWISA